MQVELCRALLFADLPRQQLPPQLALPSPRLDLSSKLEALWVRWRRRRLLQTTKPPHQASGLRYVLLSYLLQRRQPVQSNATGTLMVKATPPSSSNTCWWLVSLLPCRSWQLFPCFAHCMLSC